MRELLRSLLEQGEKKAWLKFKENGADPQKIGAYLSALASATCLHHNSYSYLVFGVRDHDLAVAEAKFHKKQCTK